MMMAEERDTDTVDMDFRPESALADNAPENPPSYAEDKPPSYDSMFGKMKQMKDESSGNADFAKKMVAVVLCGTVCSALMIALMLALPIAQIVMGALYLDQCDREPYIPIYLVVAGAFGLVKALLQMAQQICKKCCGDDDDEDNQSTGVKCLRIADGPLSCFLVCWFIAGAVWTYRMHNDYQSHTPGVSDYCQETLYLFSFWSITVTFIMMALAILCCCVGGLIACCCMASK